MVDVLLTDKLSVPLMDVNIKLIYTTLAIMKCGFNQRLDIGARQYPVNNVSSMVNMTRSIQVPSGQTNCQTYYIGNMAQTSCTQVMRTELIPYQQMVVRDTNSSPRQAVIDSCAQNICYRKFGNGECK